MRQHFKFWSKLERQDFYFTEEDYLQSRDGVPVIKKSESPVRSRSRVVAHPNVKSKSKSKSQADPSVPSLRRSRRSAAAYAKSYVIPDSDDEEIVEEDEVNQGWSWFSTLVYDTRVKKKKEDTNLQLWIQHLTILLKDEEKKVCVILGLCATFLTLMDCFVSIVEREEENGWKR